MLNWSKISTVLLDMDGTILDLHFDNHFWLEHFPARYSEQHGISVEEAKQKLIGHYQELTGTIEWYCLDYWTEFTQMPIPLIKREIQHLIQLREDADEFLTVLKQSGREVILVTNAHPDALSLKIERTQLDKYFDVLYSTHEFGVVKESQLLWQRLQAKQGFDVNKTLFVDDSLPVLKSAQKYGIKHILAVENPDSKKPANSFADFTSISDYRQLTKDILANPIKSLI
ncbi:GMP/IMP nucleotidase [Candidatus Colwellia aromaticivorans]|uniref:GMP/IMP nucleotidase n=1 Tax=Candidatus Colwellia aromaticivorans TaxID=2267621 RepID=UPI000DF4079D|nr:GMP/IMP nucleotidase [Candidatus Colwellia aromaticivorans]